MAKFGGFGGGSNMQMQNLMRQAQQMQQKALEAQEEIDGTVLEGTSGGGMVTVKIFGNKEVQEVKLQKEVVDPDDVEMLEDMIVAAFNDASQKADKLKEEKLGAFGAIGGLM
ncbi:MAG: YbaB/EbfC family nucleoid-associated protein [Clostridia bacterium]|nr:YbaB/EbfC family nucleoid-associated protein [Clostridia bacterium]